MSNIEKELKENIIHQGIDMGIDGLELTLDSFLDDGILKDIPVVKSLYSLYKVGHSIRNIHFTKKLLCFLNEYHSGNLSYDKVNEMKCKMEEDSFYSKEVIENILVIIDRLDSELKSRIFAKLFISHIQGSYSWDEVIDLSLCIERLFISDLRLIRNLIQQNGKVVISELQIKDMNKNVIFGSCERLKSFAFAEECNDKGDYIVNNDLKQIKLTSYGSKFYNLCLHGLI